MKKYFKLKNIILSLLVAIVSFLLISNQALLKTDYRVTDIMYSRLRQINRDIVIVGIDEDTLTEYGKFDVFARDKVADLINYLYSDENNQPIAVGLDILFQGENNEEIDTKLANACKGRNVVGASIIKFKSIVNTSTFEYDPYNIEMIEYAYEPLKSNLINAYANTLLCKDGVVRFNAYSFDYNGQKLESFAYRLANLYAKAKNIELPEIKTDKNGQYKFFYAGKPKEFAPRSMKTVLEGKIPTSEFKDKIVLVGAYASAMQDEFYPSLDIDGTMYGVEIHANILQAIIDGETGVYGHTALYGLIFAICAFFVCLFGLGENIVLSMGLTLGSILVNYLVGKVLVTHGLIIPQIYAIAIFGILALYFLISKFVIESRRRKYITQVFNRYMDPKLVSRLSKEDSSYIKLNGEKRNVSVLFVDIRGFTTMSESMDPADVVSVLNEYLGNVTECIFKHNGMLDKFIGDAAMAVFNAPIDQDDYIYESVATAYDIAQRAQKISDTLFEKYGKRVSYGVGVHCGEAIIGNIGCKTRMDYTAIGDTVNTSSRIEGKAQRGEVLISKEVKDALDGRIIVEDAGKIELKGKAEPVSVFRLIGLKEGNE